jgi:hypothetical protein
MRKLFIAFVLVCAAALGTVVFTQAAALNPCTDECQADLAAQRYACAHSGLPPSQVLACYNQAQAAYQECVAACQ